MLTSWFVKSPRVESGIGLVDALRVSADQTDVPDSSQWA